MQNDIKLTKRQAIELLRKEAQELEDKKVNIREYAANARRAKMRRDLADKLERELENELK